MEKKVSKKDLNAKEALDFLKKNLESKVENFQKKCLELRKAEQDALEKAQKKKLAKPMMNMDSGLGAVSNGNNMAMGEKKMEKVAPPGREEQVKELKGKVDNPYAVAWASYKKGKASRNAKKTQKMDPLWDPHSKPDKLEDPKFGDAPSVASLNPGKAKSRNLTGKSPKNPVDELPAMGKNDTLIDPKNQNDPEKRLKTLEGGQPSVLPGDKKVAEPNKGEGSGGDPEKIAKTNYLANVEPKHVHSDFAGPSESTLVGKKPKELDEIPLKPLVPEGHDAKAQVQRIKTFLGKKRASAIKKFEPGQVLEGSKDVISVGPLPKKKKVQTMVERVASKMPSSEGLGKAAGMPQAPKMPKPKSALGMSNPGGTPGGAMKTDGPMSKEVFKPSVKMRKNMEVYEKLKKKKEKLRKDSLMGYGGNTPSGLGNTSQSSISSTPLSSPAPMSAVSPGGGVSPQSTMPALGTPNQGLIGAPKNPLPQKRGGGGVGTV